MLGIKLIYFKMRGNFSQIKDSCLMTSLPLEVCNYKLIKKTLFNSSSSSTWKHNSALALPSKRKKKFSKNWPFLINSNENEH